MLYGGVQLSQTSAVLAAGPNWMRAAAPLANTAMMYLLIVFGLLTFRELSLGKVRTLIEVAAALGLAIAIAGILLFAITGSGGALLVYNNLLAACLLVVLTSTVAVPSLSRKYLDLPDRGVLAIGTLVFALQALSNSLSRPLGFGTARIFDHLGFAILLFSFAYVALQLVLDNERRLLSIENELAVARQIQTAILPGSVPELEHASISAAYHPMSAVAGDFYEFIPVDRHRVGFLVADVCGHGVPAALIASMVKMAAGTVTSCASDPGAVLRALNRMLTAQLKGQLVSAAYLWFDTEKRQALYSAAGHPPLLRWRQDTLERFESNGILFGVLPNFSSYPVCTIDISPGDRFLISTDGVTEPENTGGEAFGEKRLEQGVRANRSCTPSELSERVLSEIRHWQGPSTPQQDDITLIVIDAFSQHP